MFSSLVFILAGYLIGSISFAVVVSRAMGLPSPHQYGSCNPGATNVLRTGSKTAALLTLLGDAVKGGLALWLAQRIGTTMLDAPHQIGEFTLASVALAAFLGHLYPVFFGFRGGKGVATAAGILVVMNAAMGAVILGVWILVAVVTRYSSLAAITAALTAPVAAWVTFGQSWFTLAVLCMAALLLWRHRGNIAKLRAGTESRIRLKRGGGDSSPDGRK
ncbi:MAG: glycerol-3-phosphate acyltransferase [Betaproteobacteria bacterium SG8_40]|nr:MAG: glycerol-3-phosphate acyltransferase [Betaproteobacteria bacterium SG8_40]